MSNRFNSVLIANRGEIACRVIRTVQEQGYRAIAIYSDADTEAPHVALADEAIHIGPSPVQESYLNISAVLDAARRAAAEAIHPGYGFLSENTEFASAVADAGMVFIGPPANAVEVMGDKAAAKKHMLNASVSCIPGYEGESQDDDTLIAEAKKMKLPIMVKAAAGGGGRGMRLVESWDDLASAISLARSEAENAFGDGRLILEQAILDARHVEVQVMADQHGNVLHFGERDCSVQRRHQKVIEEAPCPVLDEALRDKMGSEAVAAAKSINYVGAGTVEFLLDADKNFYFLEMNTRLQVEHPVTELVYGVDLVALQLKVAQGEALDILQSEIAPKGHAMEVRLYAEDPENDFLPCSGEIARWWPAPLDGVRYDSGVCSGQQISPYYDPMLVKVITYGEDRELARRRLVHALQKTALFGLQTNQCFLVECLTNPIFVKGEATTQFIGQQYPDSWPNLPVTNRLLLGRLVSVAALLDYCHSAADYLQRSASVGVSLGGWGSSQRLQSDKRYTLAENSVDVSLVPFEHTLSEPLDLLLRWREDSDQAVEAHKAILVEHDGTSARVLFDEETLEVTYQWMGEGRVYLNMAGTTWLYEDEFLSVAGSAGAGSDGNIAAPMHGNILEISVSEGDEVAKGQQLLVLEAMKMQMEVLAPADGVVAEVIAQENTQVAADQLLMVIDLLSAKNDLEKERD